MTQEERNILKGGIQNEIVELSITYPFLTIEAGTGSGKGLAVIRCIDKDKSGKKWLICVPEIAQITNFRGEIEKFNYERIYDKIEDIICYASLKNYEGNSINLALNEVQNLTDTRFEIIKSIHYDRIIADSATIPFEIKYKLNELGDFYTYSLPLKEGIALGILPQPKIYTIPVSISSIKETFEYTKFKKKIKGSAEQYYNHLTDQIKYWRDRYNRERAPWIENKSLQYASMRKRFLASLKTIKAKEIIDGFKHDKKRFICFSGSIKQANELGTEKYTVNSKKTAKKNAEIIEKFNKFEINAIYPVGMLISGMTLSQLDRGLVVQLDSGSENDSLKIIQCCGRILRSEDPELYILYIPGTNDEKYLKNAISALGEEFIIKN